MSFASNTRQPRSWGRYPRVEHSQVQSVYWRSDVPDLAYFEQSLLPYAYGRSYGDSCLNEGGVSLDMSHLRRFISFDEEEGILCCEAGVSLAEVLELVVPRGWFILVPGLSRLVGLLPMMFTARIIIGPARSVATSPVLNCCARMESASSAPPMKIVSFFVPLSAAWVSRVLSCGPSFA